MSSLPRFSRVINSMTVVSLSYNRPSLRQATPHFVQLKILQESQVELLSAEISDLVLILASTLIMTMETCRLFLWEWLLELAPGQSYHMFGLMNWETVLEAAKVPWIYAMSTLNLSRAVAFRSSKKLISL